MIARYNYMSFVFGVPGIVISYLPFFIEIETRDPRIIEPLLIFGGFAIFTIGLAYYAKSKGRNLAWCAFGLLSFGGFAILHFLKDYCPDGKPVENDAAS